MQLPKSIRSLALALPLVVGCGANDLPEAPANGRATTEVKAPDTEKAPAREQVPTGVLLASRDTKKSLGSPGDQGAGKDPNPVLLGEAVQLHQAPKVEEPELTTYVPIPPEDEKGNPTVYELDELSRPITHPIRDLTNDNIKQELGALGVDKKYGDEELSAMRKLTVQFINGSINKENNKGLTLKGAVKMAMTYLSVEKELRENGSPEALAALKAAGNARDIKELEGILKEVFKLIDSKKVKP